MPTVGWEARKFALQPKVTTTNTILLVLVLVLNAISFTSMQLVVFVIVRIVLGKY